jgi:hypothetical protein
MPFAFLIPAAATLIGANMSSRSAKSAAQTTAQSADRAAELQRESSREALALQQRMYEESVARQQPYYQAGTNALAQMQGLTGAMPAAFSYGAQQPAAFAGQVDLTRDPGYAFRLREGLKAMERGAAARGGLISGAALRAGQRYGQDLASQEYGNAYNRSLTEYNAARQREGEEYNRALTGYNAARMRESEGYNRLAGLAGVGGTTAQQLTAAGQQYGQQAGNLLSGTASNIGNIMMGQGQTAANAALARGSAYAGGLNQLGYLAGRYYGQPQGAPSGAVVSTPYDYGVDQQFSDVRLKTNIVKVGTREDGLNIYEFDYVWGGPRRVGLMAQEVQNVYPDAVAEVDGYLTVDYAKV